MYIILKTYLVKTYLVRLENKMFIGRKEELEILDNKYNNDKFEFGYLYGQRRIGKTSLLDEFSKNKKALILFASDSDDTSIRNDFSLALGRLNNNPSSVYPSWELFFEAVSSYFGDEKGVMVIDEYPNILLTRDGKRKKTDFVSKLQNAIDRMFSHQKFLLVITGSNVSFMEKEVNDTNAPLYQRNTFQLLLTKLEWSDSISLLKGMNKNDIIKTLCLTDTFPFYLSNIDTNLSFDENIDRLFFSKEALFANDPSKLLTSEIETSGLYSGIMKCIANGFNTITSISEAINLDTATISIYLDKLMKNKVVSKHYMFNSTRATYYKIIDRMTAFYFRFILSNSENIKLGYGKAIKQELLNKIDDFVHHAFEDLCITYLENQSKQIKLNGLFLEYSNYKVENSSLGRSIEIDIVSKAKDRLLIGECKMTENKKSIAVLERMKENASVPPFNHFKHIDYYIFSTAGFTDSLLNINMDNVHLIDTDILLK